MRSKEEANDYRYFPDPDLLPVVIDDASSSRSVRASLPELPDAKRERFMRDYALPAYDAQVLTVERRARRLLRSRRQGDEGRAEDRRELGHGRAHGRAESRRARDRRSARLGGDARERCSTSSRPARSRARSRRKCSKRSGRRRRRGRRDHRQARPRADFGLGEHRQARRPTSSPRTRRRSSSSAPASSRCSASSSAKS